MFAASFWMKPKDIWQKFLFLKTWHFHGIIAEKDAKEKLYQVVLTGSQSEQITITALTENPLIQCHSEGDIRIYF